MDEEKEGVLGRQRLEMAWPVLEIVSGRGMRGQWAKEAGPRGCANPRWTLPVGVGFLGPCRDSDGLCRDDRTGPLRAPH